MSTRLFKGGPQVGVAFAPFSIPAQTGAGAASEAGGQAGAVSAEEACATPVNRAMIEAAKSEAEQLLTAAKASVAQLEAEAYEQGLTKARGKIEEEIMAAVDDLRGRLSHTLSELEPLYALITARAERDLVKLAVEIARKVVHREVATDADIVLTLARVALERLHPRAVATVLLHPEDFEYVNTRRQALSSTGAIEIVADRAVGRGGCIVQSEHGDIDARIEQQFASIERGFFE